MKKLIVAMLTGGVIFGLAGCGSVSDDLEKETNNLFKSVENFDTETISTIVLDKISSEQSEIYPYSDYYNNLFYDGDKALRIDYYLDLFSYEIKDIDEDTLTVTVECTVQVLSTFDAYVWSSDTEDVTIKIGYERNEDGSYELESIPDDLYNIMSYGYYGIWKDWEEYLDEEFDRE